MLHACLSHVWKYDPIKYIKLYNIDRIKILIE